MNNSFSLGEQVLTSPESWEMMSRMGFAGNPITNRDTFMSWTKGINPRNNPDGTLRERHLLDGGKTNWEDPYNATVLATARSMRMTSGEIPLCNDVDLAIVIGAARAEPHRRPEYIAGFSMQHKIGRLVVAGSKRILPEPELKVIAHYAPSARIEYDLAVEGAKITAMKWKNLLIVPFMATMEPAHNEVVIEAILDAFGGSKIAVVTTMIYGLAAEMDMRRVAKRRGIEEAAIVCNPSSPDIIANRSELTYIAEILRTWESAMRAMTQGI